MLSEQSFTLALIDIQMPGISGWDIIKFIRGNEDAKLQSMLSIAVTAYAMAGDRERVLNAGFDGYVAKPIDVTTFMQTLQETIAIRSGQGTPPADAQESAPAQDRPEPDPSMLIQDPSIAGEKNGR